MWKWIESAAQRAWAVVLFCVGIIVALLMNSGIELALQTAIAFWPYVLSVLLLWGVASLIRGKLQSKQSE